MSSMYPLIIGATDVTDDVLARGIVFSRGVSARRLLAPEAGQMRADLDNSDLIYNEAATPLAKGQEVSLRGPLDVPMFGGLLESQKHSGRENLETVEIDAYGLLARLTTHEQHSTALYRDIRSDEAIHAILDAVDIPLAMRDLDVGLAVFRWWWMDNENPMAALLRVWHSEGPWSLIYEDRDGRICFRNRNTLYEAAASIERQATYGYTEDA